MKSVKPGRGPSIQGAVAGSAAAGFGLVWTIFSINLGAPFIFPIFGIVFIGLAVFQAVYNLKNAAGKNRFSVFDIVDENEEPDPLNKLFSENEADNISHEGGKEAGYCPYCGTGLDVGFEFCPKCGKKLPR